MSTRISKTILIPLLLTACGEGASLGGDAPRHDVSEVEQPLETVTCVVGGSEAAQSTCTVERDGAILTIRHPDGGFRRFELAPNGQGLIAADGAEVAHHATLFENMLEVQIGDERYRLPAAIWSPKAGE